MFQKTTTHSSHTSHSRTTALTGRIYPQEIYYICFCAPDALIARTILWYRPGLSGQDTHGACHHTLAWKNRTQHLHNTTTFRACTSIVPPWNTRHTLQMALVAIHMRTHQRAAMIVPDYDRSRKKQESARRHEPSLNGIEELPAAPCANTALIGLANFTAMPHPATRLTGPCKYPLSLLCLKKWAPRREPKSAGTTLKPHNF